MLYSQNNVFDEAINRIRMLFDNFPEIIVCMSGGKDSTVLFNLALMVAREKGRLPLKVFWLDQEAEWQHTVDYMNWVMRLPEVEPLWFQIPFAYTQSITRGENLFTAWDEAEKSKWIRQKSDISIKTNPLEYNRFHDLVIWLPTAVTEKECAVLVGMRMAESPRRRMSITGTRGKWHGITWCTTNKKNTRKFWPIYDFSDDDVWTAIARNHWKYNSVYDDMYRIGIPKHQMRVSSLIHETAITNISILQELEPATYNRYCARIEGTNALGHAFDYGSIIPRSLPFMFRDWKEYRDYLLHKLIEPENIIVFQNRWKGQEGEDWYRQHVREVIINDNEGTTNQNHAYQVYSKGRLEGKYKNRDVEKFKAYMEEKND